MEPAKFTYYPFEKPFEKQKQLKIKDKNKLML